MAYIEHLILTIYTHNSTLQILCMGKRLESYASVIALSEFCPFNNGVALYCGVLPCVNHSLCLFAA